MHNWKRIIRLAAATTLMAGAIGISGPASAQTPTKVRVGGVASMLYLPFYVAVEEGYLKKRGIEIDMVIAPNPVPAVLAGELDLILTASDTGVVAAFRGKPVPGIVMMQGRNSQTLSASTKLKLPNAHLGYPKNLEDLRGKTIGILNRGSGAEMFVKQSMAGNGMTEGPDYNIIVINSPSGLIASVKAGQVDAVELWAPFQELSWADKAAVPLVREAYEGPANRHQAAGVSIHINPDYLKANRETVVKVVEAVAEADAFTRDYAKNKERLIDIGVKYLGANWDRVVLDTALQTVSKLAYPGIDCAAWERTAQGLLEAKTIDSIPKCADMVALDVAPKGPLLP